VLKSIEVFPDNTIDRREPTALLRALLNAEEVDNTIN